MLTESENRILNRIFEALEHFDTEDASNFMEERRIFRPDHSNDVTNKPTPSLRRKMFLHFYRRHAHDLSTIMEYFKVTDQEHVADQIETFTFFAANDPKQTRPIMVSPYFSRQMRDRILLMGGVPSKMICYQRNDVVYQVMEKLEVLSESDHFCLFVHGRAGVGKSVITAQALGNSDELVGVCYDSVIWLNVGSSANRTTFDIFSDMLLMLRNEGDLQAFPSVENTTTMSLRRMVANALIDKPNLLCVFDDVVLEETVRWCEELRLRCVITTRDVTISSVAASTCDFVEVKTLDDLECVEMLRGLKMEEASTIEKKTVLSKTIELTSGTAAVLGMMARLCDQRMYPRMAQLNKRLETRGVTGIECISPYNYRTYDLALQRCVERLGLEDREALAYSVVIPPGVEVPLKIWAAIIPVNICSSEPSVVEEEVASRLINLSKKGHFLTLKVWDDDGIVEAFTIDYLVHLFLKFSVDKDSIRHGIQTLENKLLELANNNDENRVLPNSRRDSGDSEQSFIFAPTPSREYTQFLVRNKAFYDNLKLFVG